MVLADPFGHLCLRHELAGHSFDSNDTNDEATHLPGEDRSSLAGKPPEQRQMESAP